MNGTVNKVILIGNLGKDPEIRRLENGAVVATFSIATSESFTDKNSGEKKEITDWHDIVLWRGLAEIAEKYIRKGTKIYVEGKLKKRSWQDKEGNTKYNTEVIGEELTILSRLEISDKTAAPYNSSGTPNLPSDMPGLSSSSDDDSPF
ncbi:MAG: single-stranded DNA-binding protein [Flavobacteriales bacterium]|jgi:single-strand DNA-binding protein|nr:single-stranded DNA-binding protein [Flavobacteriia bacterium]NBW30603.1 single-stranded DNA-binding protein [Flavobacteriales bacterium]NDC28325.1 single-stranded DNA-binding protein [Crocinitomicaceae bacterium]NDC92864.1 single-stranded DNA-binding protein [Flavobacteriales bacterium]